MNTISKKELTAKLGTINKVANFEHKNQYEIQCANGIVFQSYETLIGAKINGKLYLASEHDCSNTTSKHCTMWCGYDAKTRRKMLKDGTAILIEDAE